jgi:hypothetical protein
METDPISKMLFSLMFFRKQDGGQGQNANNSECYTASSQPFRIYPLTIVGHPLAILIKW